MTKVVEPHVVETRLRAVGAPDAVDVLEALARLPAANHPGIPLFPRKGGKRATVKKRINKIHKNKRSCLEHTAQLRIFMYFHIR